MGKQNRKRMIKFSVYVEADTFDKLLVEARKDRRPLSQWVAYKLENYVKLFAPDEGVADGCKVSPNHPTESAGNRRRFRERTGRGSISPTPPGT